MTVHVRSCLTVKAVVRSLPGLLNVWLSHPLPRDVARDSCLPWRPSPVSSIKMRSSCVLQQGNLPSPGSAWGSLGPSLCSAPLRASAPGEPLASVKHGTASSAGWLRGCGMVVHLCPNRGASHSNATWSRSWKWWSKAQGCLPLASSCPHPVPQFTLLLHGDDHTCLPRRLVNVIFKALDERCCKCQL